MTELWDLRSLDPALMAAADLLDLGAGKGNRLAREAQQFGAEHPLGLDRDRAKVARGQAAGRPVYEADFTQLDAHAFPNVKVVVFDNVLEHLPSLDVVELAFERACAIAPRVLYIRHPSFEDTAYLDSLGVKQYWTDWQGHTAHVRVQELIDMATRRGVYDILVRPIRRAHGTDDPTILPASAPPNQRKAQESVDDYGLYDEAVHGPKPTVAFDRSVYFAFDLFFFVNGAAPSVRYQGDPEREVAHPILRWDHGSYRRPQFVHRARRLFANIRARTSNRFAVRDRPTALPGFPSDGGET